MIRLITLLALALFSLTACYLFNSRDPSPPPQDVFHKVILANPTEAKLHTLFVWQFARETVTSSGFRIVTGSHLRSIGIPDRSR